MCREQFGTDFSKMVELAITIQAWLLVTFVTALYLVGGHILQLGEEGGAVIGCGCALSRPRGHCPSQR